jgi:hypothetical protein
MHPFIQKTFGGLSGAYYFRQLFFGFLFALALFFFFSRMPTSTSRAPLYLFLLVNVLLYPYSRFVYEGIVGFIMGNNVFFVGAFFMIFVKYITMAMCFVFAIFIAPVGLAYLYWYHSRKIG